MSQPMLKLLSSFVSDKVHPEIVEALSILLMTSDIDAAAEVIQDPEALHLIYTFLTRIFQKLQPVETGSNLTYYTE